MWKDKLKIVTGFIVKHGKILFPVGVIAAVAATVVIALNAGGDDREIPEVPSSSAEEVSTEETLVEDEVQKDVSMVLNEDPAITQLITTFYNAIAEGNLITLTSICDEMSRQDQLSYQERAKYIESYPTLEIYTKPGPMEGSKVAFIYYKVVFAGHEEDAAPGYTAHYICTDENGQLYIRGSEVSDEENEFIGELMAQADVVEFNNRVTVEYNELMAAKPELLEYLSEMNSQVSAAVGVALAQENVDTSVTDTDAETGAEGADSEGETDTPDAPVEETPVENVVLFASATTTVNVRSSDSEKADKLGKVTSGTRLQILEQKVNGWTKILYEGKDGYIKSEFLQVEESTSDLVKIGTVTATTNINVRSAEDQASVKLGVLVGGETVDLYANENGWCKINYGGKIGYVKADYVEIN